MTKSILLILVLSLYTVVCFCMERQTSPEQNDIEFPTERDSSIILFFKKGDTKLYAQKGIVALTRIISKYKEELHSGRVVLRVDGYCGSFSSPDKNLRTANERSRQLKSYLIIQHGLREEHFITRNHPSASRAGKDAGVTVYLTLTASLGESKPIIPESHPSPLITPLVPTLSVPESPKHQHPRRPLHLAVKTNLLYDLATLTNVGIELQITPKLTADIPVIFSPFKIKPSYQLRVLALQPEIRYWFRNAFSGSFLGLHTHIGWYNIAFNNKTRYQDLEMAYGFGLSYGYSRSFSPHWGMEYTIGGGYIHLRYGTYYNIPNGARNNTYIFNYWGVTRLGINLFYKL